MIQKVTTLLFAIILVTGCSSKPKVEEPAPVEKTAKTKKLKKKKAKKVAKDSDSETPSAEDSSPEAASAEEPSKKDDEKKSETAEVSAKDKSTDLWGVWGIKKDTITFNNQKTLKTGLSQVKVIATPLGKNNTRYILVSGKECGGKDDCGAYVNMYVHRWEDDPAKSFTGGGAPYPGKLADYRTQNILQHYRVYWGECISGLDPMAIWIGWTMSTKKKRVKVAAAYVLNGEPPEFTSFDVPHPKISEIQPQVDAGTCHLVEEMDQDTPSY